MTAKPKTFLGGFIASAGAPRRPALQALAQDPGSGPWQTIWKCDAPGSQVTCRGQRQILVRGYVTLGQDPSPLSIEHIADRIVSAPAHDVSLGLRELEGSFTIAVLDPERQQIDLYRNLVGAGFTYYTQLPDGFLFGSNLSQIASLLRGELKENSARLPDLFLFRYVPGNETLFQGIHRLLPGELVTFQGQKVTRRQLESIPAFDTTLSTMNAVVDRIEATLGLAVSAATRSDGKLVTLLSGGVDSTYLQAILKSDVRGTQQPIHSASVCVAHDRTEGDTQYAISASEALGTKHQLCPANAPYLEYLADLISSTGEFPSHVQSAYFAPMPRELLAQGYAQAMCGEAGDGLFGVGTANHLQNANVIRRLAPLHPLRVLLQKLTGPIHSRLSWYFSLADHLYDDQWHEHPVNRQALFADWPAVYEVFGRDAVSGVLHSRRKLLDHYRVPEDPLSRLHAANFFTSSMDSASLWTGLFELGGMTLYSPFLDSRVVKLAMSIPTNLRFPFRQPKRLLKEGLARHVGHDMAFRKKLGFGQPIFEWLSSSGQLRPAVDLIANYSFLKSSVIDRCRKEPTWFLYTLLCYDVWKKAFFGPVSEPATAEKQVIHAAQHTVS